MLVNRPASSRQQAARRLSYHLVSQWKKHRKGKDHKLRVYVQRTPRRRRPRSRPCSRRAAPLRPARSTPWCRRASARGPRPHLMPRRRSCSAGRAAGFGSSGPHGGALPHGSGCRAFRATWGSLGKANERNARVPRQQRAQQREKGRGGSVLCGCPPGNLDLCGVQHKPVLVLSRRTRVFPKHGSARGVAGSRGCAGCEGLRRFTLKSI